MYMICESAILIGISVLHNCDTIRHTPSKYLLVTGYASRDHGIAAVTLDRLFVISIIMFLACHADMKNSLKRLAVLGRRMVKLYFP